MKLNFKDQYEKKSLNIYQHLLKLLFFNVSSVGQLGISFSCNGYHFLCKENTLMKSIETLKKSKKQKGKQFFLCFSLSNELELF